MSLIINPRNLVCATEALQPRPVAHHKKTPASLILSSVMPTDWPGRQSGVGERVDFVNGVPFHRLAAEMAEKSWSDLPGAFLRRTGHSGLEQGRGAC